MAEAVVVFEELGRALVPGPLVGTFLAARAGPGRRAPPRGAPGSACTAQGAGPNLVEHLGSLDALLVFTFGGRSARGPVRLLAPVERRARAHV